MKLQFILLRQFVANFLNLLRIADHESEVFRTIGLQLLDFKNGHELMLAEFAPGRSLAAAQHLQSEHVLIELHRFFGVGDFDHHMVATVYMNRHASPLAFHDPSAVDGPVRAFSMADTNTSTGWAPEIPYLLPKMKYGTPRMPNV
jgi:hypothetical protein